MPTPIRVLVVSDSFYSSRDICNAIRKRFGDRVIITEMFRTEYFHITGTTSVVIGNGKIKAKVLGFTESHYFPQAKMMAKDLGIPYISFAKSRIRDFFMSRLVHVEPFNEIPTSATLNRVTDKLEVIVTRLERNNSVVESALT